MVCRRLSLLALATMPIYEYRCPDGHTFEVFQRMTEPPREVCEVCGKGPVEKVLYPVSVHFKGSGFYSTDYGRGGRKKTRELAGRQLRFRRSREEEVGLRLRLEREEGRGGGLTPRHESVQLLSVPVPITQPAA